MWPLCRNLAWLPAVYAAEEWAVLGCSPYTWEELEAMGCSMEADWLA